MHGVRNIFDQYKGPENRLSHALGVCLHEDPRLLRAFLNWLKIAPPSGQTLEVTVQVKPGSPYGLIEEEGRRRGLPDIWITAGTDWCLLIENKVECALTVDQLERHKRTALRQGFTRINVAALTLRSLKVPNSVVCRTWPDVYSWLRAVKVEAIWSQRLAEYLEIAESQMVANEYLTSGTLTRFHGVPFGKDEQFTYLEGKRVLSLLMAELRKERRLRKLGVNSATAGRTAITGKDGRIVWDFLPLSTGKAFTRNPHLTVAIWDSKLQVQITLPNSASSARRNLLRLDLNDFTELARLVERQIATAIRGIGEAYPCMEILQRHFYARRIPTDDARLEFNLSTIAQRQRGSVRLLPHWLNVTFETLKARQANLQLGIGATFPYGDPQIKSPEIIDRIVRVWEASQPWLACLQGRK